MSANKQREGALDERESVIYSERDRIERAGDKRGVVSITTALPHSAAAHIHSRAHVHSHTQAACPAPDSSTPPH